MLEIITNYLVIGLVLSLLMQVISDGDYKRLQVIRGIPAKWYYAYMIVLWLPDMGMLLKMIFDEFRRK